MKVFLWEEEWQRSEERFLLSSQKPSSKVRHDEVEWFAKMVEERKHNNDHSKEKKNW